MKHFKDLQEAEKIAAEHFPENLVQFQKIKNKILHNGYQPDYQYYKPTK
jgi:hypothetical protein